MSRISHFSRILLLLTLALLPRLAQAQRIGPLGPTDRQQSKALSTERTAAPRPPSLQLSLPSPAAVALPPLGPNDLQRLQPQEGRPGQADLRDVRKADGLFAVVNGCPPDEGVMVELGLAIAWEKPVFLFRDDFRRCTDSDTYPLNLMLFTGLPETDWQAYWYGSIEEIIDPGKALARWLKKDALPFR